MDQVPGLAAPPGINQRAPGPIVGEAPSPFLSAPFAAEGKDNGFQREIAGTIEDQVTTLIEQARHDTESKVKIELKQIVHAMQGMDVRLDQLLAELDGVEPPQTAEPPMDAEAVNSLLSKVEQQWGQEIRTLKQELHQTILAHNHNADLIKHHKDTIDSLRDRCTKLQSGNVRIPEIQQQLQRLDTRLKQQTQQRKLDPYFERLSVLEQKVASFFQSTYPRGYGGLPSMVMPGAVPGVPPGVPPGMLPPGMAAPGMVAPGKGAGQKGAAVGARQKPAGGEKASYRCPTDEEVQARLSKLSLSSGGDAGSPSADAAEF